MKDGVILINCAREASSTNSPAGGLNSGKVGAGLDVFASEPPRGAEGADQSPRVSVSRTSGAPRSKRSSGSARDRAEGVKVFNREARAARIAASFPAD